jgi:hypothetical protein
MHKELERIGKKMVVMYFKVLSQHLYGESEGNHKKNVSEAVRVPAEFRTDYLPNMS